MFGPVGVIAISPAVFFGAGHRSLRKYYTVFDRANMRVGFSLAAQPGQGTVCKATEYCCPDAKHCLTPTKTSCASDAVPSPA